MCGTDQQTLGEGTMKLVTSLLGALSLTFTFNVMASEHSFKIDAKQDPYFQIKKMRLEEIVESKNGPQTRLLMEQDKTASQEEAFQFSGGELGEVLAMADQIIAFGEKIYKIVEAGRPVVNLNYAPVQVLPKVAGRTIDPMDLEYWSFPKAKKYRITYVNGFNMDVVDFTYTVQFSYNGSYNGKGKYISNAEITPEHVSVAWGYTFNANMKVVGITNRGSKVNPLAAATMQISYNVSTVIKEDRNNVTYYVMGDGQMGQL